MVVCRVEVHDGAFASDGGHELVHAIAICGFPRTGGSNYELGEGHGGWSVSCVCFAVRLKKRRRRREKRDRESSWWGMMQGGERWQKDDICGFAKRNFGQQQQRLTWFIYFDD